MSTLGGASTIPNAIKCEAAIGPLTSEPVIPEALFCSSTVADIPYQKRLSFV
jgi:hypothetical protein